MLLDGRTETDVNKKIQLCNLRKGEGGGGKGFISDEPEKAEKKWIKK